MCVVNRSKSQTEEVREGEEKTERRRNEDENRRGRQLQGPLGACGQWVVAVEMGAEGRGKL